MSDAGNIPETSGDDIVTKLQNGVAAIEIATNVKHDLSTYEGAKAHKAWIRKMLRAYDKQLVLAVTLTNQLPRPPRPLNIREMALKAIEEWNDGNVAAAIEWQNKVVCHVNYRVSKTAPALTDQLTELRRTRKDELLTQALEAMEASNLTEVQRLLQEAENVWEGVAKDLLYQQIQKMLTPAPVAAGALTEGEIKPETPAPVETTASPVTVKQKVHPPAKDAGAAPPGAGIMMEQPPTDGVTNGASADAAVTNADTNGTSRDGDWHMYHGQVVPVAIGEDIPVPAVTGQPVSTEAEPPAAEPVEAPAEPVTLLRKNEPPPADEQRWEGEKFEGLVIED